MTDELHEYCKNHPDRPATGQCARCWSHLCDECLSSVTGYRYCTQCRSVAETRTDVADTHGGQKQKRPLVRQWLMILLAFALTGALINIFFLQWGYVGDIMTNYQILYRPKDISGKLTGFKQKTTEHFIIYSHDDALAESLAGQVETTYTKILEDLLIKDTSVMTRGRFSLVLANDDAEYMKVTDEKTAGGGALSDYPTKTIYIDVARCAPVMSVALPHELTHAVVFEVMRSGTNIPTWLHEGLASYEEAKFDGSQVANRWDIQRADLVEGRHLPLATLNRPEDPGDPQAQIFYAESTSVVSYMIETYGMYKMMNFMLAIQQGDQIDAAIKKVYGPDLASIGDLETKWLASIRG